MKRIQQELTVQTIQQLTLEYWHTNLQQKPLNRCQQVRVPYKQLIQDKNETDKRTSNNSTNNRVIETDQ